MGKKLVGSHFIFIFFFNLLLFIFYLVFKVYMALKLILINHLNFFSSKLFYHIDGYPQYTLFRVFIPVFFLILFVLMYHFLFREIDLKKLVKGLLFIVKQGEKQFLKYIFCLIILFSLFSIIPDFSLLIKNPNTSYGMFDINSYISLVTMMTSGDYNANYWSEGGLQFAKYYPITIPALILTVLLGIKNIVITYNVVTTLLVFFILVNTIFTFCTFFIFNRDKLYKELFLMAFITLFVFLFFRLIMIRDYFGFYPLLWTYCSGFYGIIGGIFLFSSSLFITSYLLIGKITTEKRKIILLVAFLLGNMITQGYFNLSLLFLPASSLILAALLSQKLPISETIKNAILYSVFLAANILGYTALNIFPDFNMDPTRKLLLLSIVPLISFFVLILVNRKYNNSIYNFFLKFRYVFFLFLFTLPFLGYLVTYRGVYNTQKLFQIVSWGYPITIDTFDVNNLRLTFYAGLLISLIFAFCLYNVLNYFIKNFDRKTFKLLMLILIVTVIFVKTYDPRQPFVLNYPANYTEQKIVKDLNNKYIFDESGIKLAHSKEMVDLVKYFNDNDVHDMKFWLVSKTPSQGIYDPGLLGRILFRDGHNLEGTVIMNPDLFAENIDDFEKSTRSQVPLYKNRYLIVDNNFPSDTLRTMDNSSTFQKVHQNTLYKVYKLKNPESEIDKLIN